MVNLTKEFLANGEITKVENRFSFSKSKTLHKYKKNNNTLLYPIISQDVDDVPVLSNTDLGYGSQNLYVNSKAQLANISKASNISLLSLDWEAQAISRDFFTNVGKIFFRISMYSVGIFGGVSDIALCYSKINPSNVAYSFLYNNGEVSIYSFGVFKSLIGNFHSINDSYAIQVEDYIVRFYINDVEVYTLNKPRTLCQYVLTVLLYSAGDTIHSPIVLQTKGNNILEVSLNKEKLTSQIGCTIYENSVSIEKLENTISSYELIKEKELLIAFMGAIINETLFITESNETTKEIREYNYSYENINSVYGSVEHLLLTENVNISSLPLLKYNTIQEEPIIKEYIVNYFIHQPFITISN